MSEGKKERRKEGTCSQLSGWSSTTATPAWVWIRRGYQLAMHDEEEGDHIRLGTQGRAEEQQQKDDSLGSGGIVRKPEAWVPCVSAGVLGW